MYLYDSQCWIDEPNCTTSRRKILAHFLTCILGEIPRRYDFDCECGCTLDRRPVRVKPVHVVLGDKGQIGPTNSITVKAEIELSHGYTEIMFLNKGCECSPEPQVDKVMPSG